MAPDVSLVFVELGAAILGLAILARLANRWGFSAIPLYLLAGLAFGNGGLAPLKVSADFIHIGAEIGVLLLLFMLGLEYTGEDLKNSLRRGIAPGVVDLLLNFPPGFIAGLLLGWKPLAAVLLGGITYISSSGVIAKILSELGRLNNQETPAILSVLVLEDLAMAVYLPIVAVLLVGGDPTRIAISVSIAVTAVFLVLFIAVRYGQSLSRFAAHQSDEIILLSVLGTVLLVGGIAQRLQVSAAIGAFLVGIAVSGPMREQSHRLMAPLRDFFAAIFFFFFGLQINPASLISVLGIAAGLGLVTAITKIASGYWAARRLGADTRAALRAGVVLIARGEFSIVIAGLGATLEPRLEALSAAYVLLLALLGPILARTIK
ncbi:MAG TPA: cation:proton antiporter [Terriglobales bacterium]|jgi:CPA2 family monovalent cation:H+ antiporter-2|nr:cation:proton antiporter [Terriglobales bacterium]